MFLETNVNETAILVSVCYRAPHLRYLADFENLLLDVMACYSHIFVMGDFNKLQLY